MSKLHAFLIIWAGQVVSRVGTSMTRFALLIWAYQQTHNATTVALLGFFSFIPMAAASPFAGVWVDRFDRRKIMLLADLGAGVITAVLFTLHLTDQLYIWHLYLMAGLTGAFESFQSPAYLALTSTLIPEKHYARANGLRSLADSGAQVVAPFLGGLLLTTIGLDGVMRIDLLTFLAAFATLLVVRAPRVISQEETTSHYREELRAGFAYLRHNAGLLGILVIFAAIGFFAAITWYATLPAMILARSGHDEMALATVQGVLGIGAVAGSVVISIWGGPKRKIDGVLLGVAVSFLVGDVVMAVGRSLPVWALGAALGAFFVPIISSCHDAIWQAAVPQHLQGRVFAAANMIRQAMMPGGFLLGGVLADGFMEPAMMPGGALANTFGWLVGVGPGAGIALMFIGSAMMGIAISLGAYLIPAVRRVEGDKETTAVLCLEA